MLFSFVLLIIGLIFFRAGQISHNLILMVLSLPLFGLALGGFVNDFFKR